jgi:hypothetical protein
VVEVLPYPPKREDTTDNCPARRWSGRSEREEGPEVLTLQAMVRGGCFVKVLDEGREAFYIRGGLGDGKKYKVLPRRSELKA